MPKQNYIHSRSQCLVKKKGNKHQNDQVQWIYTVAQIKKDDYLFICRWIFEASHEIKGQCAQ